MVTIRQLDRLALAAGLLWLASGNVSRLVASASGEPTWDGVRRLQVVDRGHHAGE